MKIKKLLFFIIITFIIATAPSLFVNTADSYNNFIKPDIYPPSYLFPVIWSLLYLLMGISIYIISETKTCQNKTKSYILYFSQLIVNSLWTIIFFTLDLKLLGVFWIILLIILVIIMMIEFFKINKISTYINIPYIIWLSYALILSIQILNLN